MVCGISSAMDGVSGVFTVSGMVVLYVLVYVISCDSEGNEMVSDLCKHMCPLSP